jgi:predicted DNA-binding transcriptional regulator AlpA
LGKLRLEFPNESPMSKKKNAIAKIRKHVVSFAEGDAHRLTASTPRNSARGEVRYAHDPPNSGPLEELLTVKEVAAALRCSASCLNKWRVAGAGPKFVRVGSRVRYRPADIASFVRDCTRTSTSEANT